MGASIEDFEMRSPEEMAEASLSQQIPDSREDEYQELGDELPKELYRYDQDRVEWSSNALGIMNAVISVMQHHYREMMHGSGGAVLAQVKDFLEKNDEVKVQREVNYSLVKFTTVLGVGVHALRIGFPPAKEDEDAMEDVDPEVRAMLEEFRGTDSPGDLTFYFPIQDDAIFESLSEFSRDLLTMGLMNDFDEVEQAHSPLPLGSTWVMNARQIAALAGK